MRSRFRRVAADGLFAHDGLVSCHIPPGGIVSGMSHANNPEIVKRLRRAEGHLASVVRMIVEGRDGLLIAQQMQAVIRALEKTKQTLILDHIDNHLGEAAVKLPPQVKQKLAGFREITKYL